MIEVKNIRKKFRIPLERRDSLRDNFVKLFKARGHRDLRILDDVSFRVKKGEFFGIVGRNGSGKSTLLKIISGIYQPSSGEVNLEGSFSAFLELGVGFNMELTARENVFLNSAVLGITKAEVEAMYQEIVEFAGLEGFMDHQLKNYSSGMQMRLAFAIAVKSDTDILILDEILAVGDLEFQEKCFQKFREFKEQGKTVILVTHDMGLIRDFCDRVMFLDQGKVAALGKVEDVIDYAEKQML